MRLDHLAFQTLDAKRAAQFYCDWAGMKIVHERQDPGSTHRVAWVRAADDAGGLTVVLFEVDAIKAGGRMDHFGLHVASRAEVDVIAERAAAQNILVEGPLYSGPVIGYYCIISDPDGNRLEFSCEQAEA